MALPIDYITKNDRKLRKINTTFAVKPSSPLAPIPEAKQPSGKVSFEEGFGNKYSTPLTAGGEAIRGDNFNALMNDITTDLKNTRKVLKNEWKEPLVFTVGTRPEDDYNDLCFALHDIVMKYQPGCVGTAVGVSATDKTLWGGGQKRKPSLA